MTPPRWLVIVRRDQAQVAPRLRNGFDPQLAEVIVERRSGERRRSSVPVDSERRQSDRRCGSTSRYHLTHEGKGFQVYEARGRALVQCGTCGGALESEIPHFHEPPARLTVDVVHTERALPGSAWSTPLALAVQVKHSVEVQAFTASGRLILSCLVPARPPASFIADEWLRQIAAVSRR